MTKHDNVHKTSRRDILKLGSGVALGAAAGCALTEAAAMPETNALTPSGIACAEKLAGVAFTEAERIQMVGQLEERLAAIEALRRFDKPNTLAPATVFDPRLPGKAYALTEPGKVEVPAPRLGSKPGETDIAFASIPQLGAWLRSGVITCRHVTEVFLGRIERYAPQLYCYISVTRERALQEADRLDAEFAAGRDRGPLHGIPYGLKDLFEAEGAPVTWGAEPWQNQQPGGDATIVQKLSEAGAILLGKTSLGALAYGDIWFGGVTRNPFDPREGSSGSSAGSASATAAGLCAFSIGTETLGSLVSPSTRCGTTAIRPTFGRVSRAGGMALCWSLDKVGPIARSVEDCVLVLAAINGHDPRDASSIGAAFSYSRAEALGAMRLGVDPAWLESATPNERAAIEAARGLGMQVQDFRMPQLPAEPLVQQLLAEAAAAFEEMTLSGQDDLLTWQEDAAWPNTFRAARFLSAIDLIQIDRLRRSWMEALGAAFDGFDAVIGPSFSSGMLTPTNFTGHPCLVMRSGFEETRPRTIFGETAQPDAAPAQTPVSISLWAPLFRETAMLQVGHALEARLDVAGERPAAFA